MPMLVTLVAWYNMIGSSDQFNIADCFACFQTSEPHRLQVHEPVIFIGPSAERFSPVLERLSIVGSL